MSIADELREWAATSNSPVHGWDLGERAWKAWACYFMPEDWLSYMSDSHYRTFALLVAEALDHE